MQEKVRNLDKILEEAIEEGLNVLGSSGKQMLFFHLEKNYRLKKQEITRKPEAFAVAIEEIFGAGASVLEKIIVKNVYSKLGLKYQEKKMYRFSDYLKGIMAAPGQWSRDSDEMTEEELQVTF